MSPVMPSLLFGLVALGLVGGCMIPVAAAAPTRSVVELQTQDGPRQALVFSAGDGPHPTILVLHGANGSGEAVAAKSGLMEAAARHGFTSVFPSGLGHRWNYGPSVRGTTADDVGYLRDLVARLVKDGLADPRRFFIAGVSNGGLMTFKMACTSGRLFAGAATIIASLPAELAACPLPQIPYVMVNAPADPVMPFAGGKTGLHQRGGPVLGAMETATLLARTDDCRTAPGDGVPDSGTSTVELAWKNCKPPTFVTLFRVEKAGHTVPGTVPALNSAYGPTNEDFKAAEAILAAFDSRS